MQAYIREMQFDGIMQNILRDLKEILLSPITIVSWVTGSLVVALFGPFDTYTVIPLDQRLYFWFGILAVAAAVGVFLQMTIRRLIPSWGIIGYTCVAWLIFVVVYLGIIVAVIRVLYAHLELPSTLLLAGITASVSAAVNLMIYLISPQTLSGEVIELAGAEKVEPVALWEVKTQIDSNTPCARNPFMQRLGPDAGERLIRLAMRDHYIEVYTETGQKLVHMRFSDALDEISELNGEQVHRSHWINFDEVEGVVKDGAKIGFKMADGEIVPIARSRKPSLKERGLL